MITSPLLWMAGGVVVGCYGWLHIDEPHGVITMVVGGALLIGSFAGLLLTSDLGRFWIKVAILVVCVTAVVVLRRTHSLRTHCLRGLAGRQGRHGALFPLRLVLHDEHQAFGRAYLVATEHDPLLLMASFQLGALPRWTHDARATTT